MRDRRLQSRAERERLFALRQSHELVGSDRSPELERKKHEQTQNIQLRKIFPATNAKLARSHARGGETTKRKSGDGWNKESTPKMGTKRTGDKAPETKTQQTSKRKQLTSRGQTRVSPDAGNWREKMVAGTVSQESFQKKNFQGKPKRCVNNVSAKIPSICVQRFFRKRVGGSRMPRSSNKTRHQKQGKQQGTKRGGTEQNGEGGNNKFAGKVSTSIRERGGEGDKEKGSRSVASSVAIESVAMRGTYETQYLPHRPPFDSPPRPLFLFGRVKAFNQRDASPPDINTT
jgi:hypothetical protein